jgi:hypothetical protein
MPGSVRTSVSLLYGVVAAEVLSIALALYGFSKTKGIYEDLYRGTPLEKTGPTAITVGTIVAVSISVLICVGFAVLAVFVGRGKQAARIVTWVLAGLFALCAACSVGGQALSGSLSGLGGNTNSSQGPTAEQISKALEGALPAWLNAVTIVLSLGVCLALIAVIVLLALPASNEYFRPAQAEFIPPVAWPPPGSVPPAPGSTPPGMLPPSDQ